MINRDSFMGAIKAVALITAILAGCKLFSMIALEIGLYTIGTGWNI